MSPWAAYAVLIALTSTFSGCGAGTRAQTAGGIMAGPEGRQPPDEGVTVREARMVPLGEVMRATSSSRRGTHCGG